MTGEITLDTGSIYSQYRCQAIQDGICIQSTTVFSMSKTELKSIGSSLLFNTSIMVITIIIILTLVRGLFRKIFK